MIIEQNHDLPLCRVQLTMRTGAATDYHPAAAVGLKAGKRLDGLCNFATEMQRRGAGGKTRAALDEAADALGASVHVICYSDQVIYETVALKEYIDPACALLSDVLLRPDDIVHDDASPWRATVASKTFRGSEFLYTLALASGTRVLAAVPSHHDHAIGEAIGIRLEIDHVVAFPAPGGERP